MRANAKDKLKILMSLFTVTMMILIFKIDVEAMTGKGTETDPYMIYNISDLRTINGTGAFAYYKLAKDIDLNYSEVIMGSIFSFQGVFDGNGYTIYNLDIRQPDSTKPIGLFAMFNGTIKNLTIVGSNVYGGSEVGILVGRGNGTVENCTIKTNTVNGYSHVGGMFGRVTSELKIIDSKVINTNVKGSFGLGGMVGQGSYVNISNSSFNDGYVYGRNNVGGFVGNISGSSGYTSKITNSSVNTTITSTESSYCAAGGFVGSKSGDRQASEASSLEIRKSIFQGDLNFGRSNSYVGGFIGLSYGKTTIEDSYVNPTFTDAGYAGGFVGNIERNNLTIKNSYATNCIKLAQYERYAGTPSITNTYMLSTKTTASSVERTDADMKKQATYVGWNFENLWEIDEGYGYPKLRDVQPNIYGDTKITNVKATSITEKSMIVNWQSSIGKPTGAYYRVVYGDKSIYTNSTTVTLTELLPDTEYKIKIHLGSDKYQSPWSEEVKFRTDKKPYIDLVENFKVTKTTYDSVNLSWSKLPDASIYHITYGGKTLSTASTSIAITGLEPNTEYEFGIKGAYKTISEGKVVKLAAKTNYLPLNDISNLRVTESKQYSMVVEWNGVSEAAEYEVTYNGKTITTNELKVTIENLIPNKEYSINVKAKNEFQESAIKNIKAKTAVAYLDTPINIVVAEKTNNHILLKWDEVSYATEYEITYSGKTVTTANKEILLNDLKENTLYVISIKAKNSYTTSAPSKPMDVKTDDESSLTVKGLKYTERSYDYILLEWDEIPGATKYEIIYNGIQVSTIENSIVIKNLLPQTQYLFKASAYRGEKKGDWNNGILVDTLNKNENDIIEMPVNAVLGKEFKMTFAGDDIGDIAKKTFKIKYDNTALEVVDFATQTTGADLMVGEVFDTNLEIISIKPGEIEFKLTKNVAIDKTWSGILTIVKFKGIGTKNTTIYFEQ